MPQLSVVIITFNEERNLLRCLASIVDIADEIVIVDSFSTDKTEEIATDFVQKLTKNIAFRFIKNKFEGHIQQKNFAMQEAKNDYILSLDADEALSNELKNSILNLKKSETWANAYRFNRRTSYCGQWIWHSGWYPDKKIRLVHKNKAAWNGINPHDSLFLNDKNQKIEYLNGDLLHYSFATHEELVKQLAKFSTIAAKARFEQGEKSSYFKIFYKTTFKFFRNYILKLGFLDGKNGLIISFWTAKETYWRYSKLKNMYDIR